MSKTIGLFSIMLLIVLFLGINVTADRALSGARIDLTEGRLYTIQPASKRIAQSPAEPLRFRFYYSKNLARGIPQLEAYGRRVEEMLRSFESASGGKIELEIIDPEPFSEAEDEAVAEGVSPQPVSATSNLYFGLVATNALDGREVIPVFRPDEERFLEYRIAQIVTKLADPDKPKLGLLTGLEMLGGFDPRTQRPRAEWGVVRELRATFDIELIGPDAGELPADLDVLMVVHPRGITPETEYAIDQYVLGGGNAVVFVDPHCESDQSQQSMQMMQVGQDKSSSLPTLFDAWGVTMERGQVVGDLSLGINIRAPGTRQDIVPYVIWLAATGEQMAEGDPVTGGLSLLNIATGGAFTIADDAAVTMEPLVTTTDQSAMVAVEKVRSFPDPRALLNDFFPDGEVRTIAARLTGTPATAFPDGPPDALAEADAEAEADADEDAESVAEAGEVEPAEPAAESDQIMRAESPINVIVVADADMIEDGGWIREINMGGVVLGYDVLADNGAFAVNAAEQMAGSTDLLALRGRGEFRRPFTVLEEMVRQAEAESSARVATLQEKEEQATARLNELLMGQVDAGATTLVLTDEMQAEVDALEETQREVRKELRDVQLNLRKDVESLETRLKIINTAMVPGLLVVLALGLAGYRGLQRRADRRRGSLR